jgi:hypothetical protein
MKIFLLDLWHDLREKRLWPVALALVAALVAVPVLLAKPFESPAPAPVTKTAPKSETPKDLEALAKVKLAEGAEGHGSTLGVFDASNPFKPPKRVLKKEEEDATATGGSSTDTPATTTGGTNTGGSSGGSDTGSGNTGTGNTGGGNTGGGTTEQPTTTVTYKYVVDLTFKTGTRTRHIKGMEKLDMLPNQASPMLIFMGVTPSANDAVFLVDSTLKAAGEGRCKPSKSDCAFVYLGAGSEHLFTDPDGNSYTLRIDEIRKVKVDASSAKAGKTAKAGKAKTASAAVGEPRRFVPPVLADIVTVASGGSDKSSNHTDSR